MTFHKLFKVKVRVASLAAAGKDVAKGKLITFSGWQRKYYMTPF